MSPTSTARHSAALVVAAEGARRRDIRAALEGAGFRVVEAATQDEALARLDDAVLLLGAEPRDAEPRDAYGALRASEGRFRTLFMAVPVPTYAWRAVGDDFELVDCNLAAVEFTRGQVREWIGARASAMFADVATDYRACMRECLRTDRPVRVEVTHRLRSTGETKELDVTFAPVPPDHVLVHTVDETDRRAAERTLRASEERFRALTEHARDLLCILDADGAFRYASPSYAAVLGVPAEALVGTSPVPLIHPDDVDGALAVTRRVLAEPGALHRARVRVRDREGAYHTLDVTGQNLLAHPAVRGIVCNGRDVTAAEAAAAELRFRAHLLDAVEQAVIATTLDGVVTYCNRFAERLFGRRAEEAHGCRLVELATNGAARGRAAEVMRVLARGRSWSGELELEASDGRRFPSHVTGSPIGDAGGAPVGIVVVARDVSERRDLEAQLRQAQKMEAVGRLASGVAHDFNNLLMVIHYAAEFLGETLPPDDEAQRELAEIGGAVSRASALTRQLLAFSRRQVLQPRAVDVRQVVAEMEPMLRRLIGEHIALESRMTDGPHTVLADRGQLEQVLMNLVVNARDAMPRGGTLTIGVADVELPPGFPTHDGEAAPGPYVVLAVRDTGHGMDRGTIEHIFEPFFTTKGPGRGTGLGLSTAHGIVRQSGGHVRVSSEPGRGSAFEVYLPRHRADAAEPAPARPAARGTERLLLVEDDASVRAVARRALEQLGYSVLEAANGREALERFRAHARAIDLVVTDTVMPEMGAHELVALLRAERPALPVLYISGYTDDEVVRGASEPWSGFIQKPFTAEELGAAVRERLDPSPPRHP